jgi:exodeoxyribonuclease VII large subunit
MASRTEIYTVSQVNSLIKEVLESSLPGQLTITGEITDWKLHHSGHCYFSLKDENSQLPCVMWRGLFSRVKFQPENGLAVLATGHIDVYSPQGKYQFYVEIMRPAGVGALQLAFEQMVRKLRAEGLFDEGHKKLLPAYPERIGILTSESGAAVHDIVDSIRNRWPCVKLFLYPVSVQGEGAAQDIASALRDINRRNDKLKLDVLIVGRGGGSLEDLWAFNEEVVARAIYDSKIPVISAVGHEVDTSIADLVADSRASTPTKAGVAAVPDMYEVLGDLGNKESRLTNRIKGRLELAQQSVRTILASSVFKNPLLAVRNSEQQLDEAG